MVPPFGYNSDAWASGIAIGADANGTQTNIAIGVQAYAPPGNERIAIGHQVTNYVDNTAVMRGTLYLDVCNRYCVSINVWQWWMDGPGSGWA